MFEIAVATELVALGFAGNRLTASFKQVMANILNPRNARDADYLVLLPSDAGPMPLPTLLPGADLHANVGIWTAAHLLNVRRTRDELQHALHEWRQQRRNDA